MGSDGLGLPHVEQADYGVETVVADDLGDSGLSRLDTGSILGEEFGQLAQVGHKLVVFLRTAGILVCSGQGFGVFLRGLDGICP